MIFKLLNIGLLGIQPTVCLIPNNVVNKNINDNRNISDLILENEIGNVYEPTNQKLLELCVEKFNYLDWNYLEITDVGYNSFKVVSKENTNFYSGYKYIKYNAILDSGFSWTSKNISTNAYAKTKNDYDNSNHEYNVKLSREKFLDNYHYVYLTWKGETYNNKDGYRYYSLNISGYNTESGVSTNDNISDYVEGISKILIPTGLASHTKINLMSRLYQNTNWMKNEASLDIFWKNNFNLEFNFYLHSSSYASVWNAYWARTSEQMIVKDIIFINNND